MSHRFYVLLRVYNYDASPRFHDIQHNVDDAEEGKRLAKRLHNLQNRSRMTDNRTSKWLERNHSVYGFIEEVVGVFEKTTIKVG